MACQEIPSNIAISTGPSIISFLVPGVLYGMHIVQVYIYYLAFPNDRIAVKSLVYSIFFLNTLQTVLFFHAAFTLFGYGFGEVSALFSPGLLGLGGPILNGAMGFLVQLFYAYQIQVISRSLMVTGVVCMLALLQFVTAMYDGVLLLVVGLATTPERLRTFVIVQTTWLTGSALCDTVIAVVMTFYLLRVSWGVRKSNVLIGRLVKLIIETGSVTATVAIMNVFLFALIPQFPLHLITSSCIGKLYANTLMTVLNSRMRILGGRDESRLESGPHVVSLSGIRFTTTSATPRTIGSRSEDRHGPTLRDHDRTSEYREDPILLDDLTTNRKSTQPPSRSSII